MFICEPCRIRQTTNPEPITQSRGRCECCGEHRLCADIPSRLLNLRDLRPLFAPTVASGVDARSVMNDLWTTLHRPAWERLMDTPERALTILVEAADGPTVWDDPVNGDVRMLCTPYGQLAYTDGDRKGLVHLVEHLWFDQITSSTGGVNYRPKPDTAYTHTPRWLEALDGTLLPLDVVQGYEVRPSRDGPDLPNVYARLGHRKALLCSVRQDHAARLIEQLEASEARVVRPVEMLEVGL